MTIDRSARRRYSRVITLAAVSLSTAAVAPALAASGTFLGSLHKVHKIASTVPGNGDVNPYGIAVVPVSGGKLVAGDVLISNFNDKANKQGTGRTIVDVSPQGRLRLFASINPSKLPGGCPGGVGLTTGLVALRSGWVIVGSLPTKDGSSSTAKAGCLLVINSSGQVVKTISGGPIHGPWDMTAVDNGSSPTLFVTNVLNGTVKASPKVTNRGTVVRIGLSIPTSGNPAIRSETVIANGLPERTDPSALVVGPTGVGVSNGTLFIANSAGNAIDAVGNAMTVSSAATPMSISKGVLLRDPLGLAIAPNGDILTTNGGNGKVVEVTPSGAQVATTILDNTAVPSAPRGSGTLFGLAVAPSQAGLYYVDDGNNTLNVLH